MDCDFCATLLVKVTKGMAFRGWRHVPGSQGGPKAKRRAEAKERRKRNKNKRRKVGPDRRAAIYARDGNRCVECGEKDKGQLTLDHIIPVSKGGSSRDENLQTMCRRCNVAKGNKLPPGVKEPIEFGSPEHLGVGVLN